VTPTNRRLWLSYSMAMRLASNAGAVVPLSASRPSIGVRWHCNLDFACVSSWFPSGIPRNGIVVVVVVVVVVVID
jgi:hypothetical protein